MIKMSNVTRLCLLAGTYEEARIWARSQNLDSDSWFYPTSEEELKTSMNFYVLVLGTAGFSVPLDYFNRVYSLAQMRGKIGRK